MTPWTLQSTEFSRPAVLNVWSPISNSDKSITWELVGCANLLYPPWTYLIRNPSKMGFPNGSSGRQSTCNAGDLGLIPGWGRSSGEGNGNPLQYSFLENSMDRGAWLATVHGVVKSQTTTTDPSIHPPTPSIYLSVYAIEKCIKETKGN